MNARATSAWLAVLLVASCNSESTIGERSTPIENALTADVVAQLGRDGKLPEVSAVGRDEVSPSRAAELARSFVSTYGAFFVERWGVERGSEVTLERLRTCGVPRYAKSPYTRVDERYSGATRSQAGSWWLVPMCESQSTAVLIAVSALATDLDTHEGQLVVPRAGSEIRSVGIPAGNPLPYLRPPEAAVQEANDATGRRIAALPRLWSGPIEAGGPFASAWELRLESPLRVRSATREDREVGRVFLAQIRSEGGRMPRWDAATSAIMVEGDSSGMSSIAIAGTLKTDVEQGVLAVAPVEFSQDSEAPRTLESLSK